MELTQILQVIDWLAKTNSISKPWIVGGIPRDKILGRKNDLIDIDITTGDNSIHALAQKTAIKLALYVSSFVVLNDGHSRMIIDNWKFDFSSNFKVPNIKFILEKNGMKNVVSMDEEIFSRDFTCNTLLLSLDLKQMYDVTQRARTDISNKIIDTCLDPDITLKNDPKRIVRVIYLASKLNFSISERVENWIQKNSSFILKAGNEYNKKKIIKALKYNPEICVQLLDKFNLWRHLPVIPELAQYMNKPERI